MSHASPTTTRRPVAFGLLAAASLALAAPAPPDKSAVPAEEGWVSLFNGKDLTGWTPKIRGYPAGEDPFDTFRVEGGVIKVSYDKYPKFDDKFGHLFSKQSYSRYRLRIEYRFVGEQCPGGPGWALRNSGVMVHSQSPETMSKDQDFPVSIEAQFLGGAERGERPTLNLCTPGTHVVMDGALFKTHCVNSKSKTIRGDEWVTAEVEAHGNGKFTHYVNGDPVITYEQPQLDDSSPDARELLRQGAAKMLTGGHFALQSESHPIEFRKVEVLVLED